MAANISQSEVDCTCPVCCDIFTDPVVLLCGHSFCKYCLQEWWRQSGIHNCPICKEVFPMAQPPPNLALRNLSDNLRQERTQKATSGTKDVCILHSEKLKLFCETDQQLICVICRDAQKHKKHNCVPINEAAEDHRTKIKVHLMHLKSTLGTYKSEKAKYDKMASHIKIQAQQTENTIKKEFQKLYQFLRAEEVERIDAVRKEAKVKSEAVTIRSFNLTAEISSLTDKIQTILREMKADNFSFMLNVKSTMEGSKSNLSKPHTPSGALLDEAKHLGNLLFAVWKKMKNLIKYRKQCNVVSALKIFHFFLNFNTIPINFSLFVLYFSEAPLTMDPNTGYMNLTESEGLTRLTNSDKILPLPDNPERLSPSKILASEGFSSGKHSWDVEVSGYWAVGVAAKPMKRYYERVWAMYMCACTAILRELTPKDYVKVISEDLFPQKVRVQLDYDKGILSFFDLDRKKTVHTIKYTFTEQVFPYFCENSKILPFDVSVKIRQPT